MVVVGVSEMGGEKMVGVLGLDKEYHGCGFFFFFCAEEICGGFDDDGWYLREGI